MLVTKLRFVMVQNRANWREHMPAIVEIDQAMFMKCGGPYVPSLLHTMRLKGLPVLVFVFGTPTEPYEVAVLGRN